jgi:hypothetical protein
MNRLRALQARDPEEADAMCAYWFRIAEQVPSETPCSCGHTLEDHASLGSCTQCECLEHSCLQELLP